MEEKNIKEEQLTNINASISELGDHFDGVRLWACDNMKGLESLSFLLPLSLSIYLA